MDQPLDLVRGARHVVGVRRDGQHHERHDAVSSTVWALVANTSRVVSISRALPGMPGACTTTPFSIAMAPSCGATYSSGAHASKPRRAVSGSKRVSGST